MKQLIAVCAAVLLAAPAHAHPIPRKEFESAYDVGSIVTLCALRRAGLLKADVANELILQVLDNTEDLKLVAKAAGAACRNMDSPRPTERRYDS